jgi:NAD(P)-dependent dehydrogenase (short-subunit alcohol dehydrogenase family)
VATRDRVVVVTGGIGQACVEVMPAAGGRPVVLDAVAAGSSAVPHHQADVTDEGRLGAALSAVDAR